MIGDFKELEFEVDCIAQSIKSNSLVKNCQLKYNEKLQQIKRPKLQLSLPKTAPPLPKQHQHTLSSRSIQRETAYSNQISSQFFEHSPRNYLSPNFFTTDKLAKNFLPQQSYLKKQLSRQNLRKQQEQKQRDQQQHMFLFMQKCCWNKKFEEMKRRIDTNQTLQNQLQCNFKNFRNFHRRQFSPINKSLSQKHTDKQKEPLENISFLFTKVQQNTNHQKQMKKQQIFHPFKTEKHFVMENTFAQPKDNSIFVMSKIPRFQKFQTLFTQRQMEQNQL